MRIEILTIFPEMFQGPFDNSIIKRAQEQNLISINLVDIRDFALDKHRCVDDYPFGGGVGMVMKPEPVCRAVEQVLGDRREAGVILMCPQGERFTQAKAAELARRPDLVFICGHYEGIDERVRSLVTDEVSIGDYVLTGGELAAMVVIDAVVRLIPGVLGEEESARQDSFVEGLLEYPQYTRPREFRGMMVPEVLLSGHHERIRVWRRKESLRRTWKRRPDLLTPEELSAEDRRLLDEVLREEEADPAREEEQGD
jgi:tRNA (guanine37-N1)-methyltransferase